MGVEFDFSDVDQFFKDGEKEVVGVIDNVKDEAVQYAKDNGNYQDHSGNLRKSNKGEADKTGLTLENETEYASYVEARGYEVLESAALFAEKRLKEEFE